MEVRKSYERFSKGFQSNYADEEECTTCEKNAIDNEEIIDIDAEYL